MRVIVVTTQVPFVRGGAEIHAEQLRDAVKAAGHEVDIVAIPFRWYPPERILDHMLACRLLDLGSFNGVDVDRVIALKFPAYYVKHKNKVLWVLHQHRTAYELWDSEVSDLVDYPNGIRVRDAIRRADRELIPQSRRVFANSGNVASRMKAYCGIDAAPLYHPPRNAGRFFCGDPEDYLFLPSRITHIKRQSLVIEALALTRNPVVVRFCGTADDNRYEQELKSMADKLGVANRVQWLGEVTEQRKRELFARCLAVIYPPLDEDLGYVTMEAMLSSKPVLTCRDSGGTLEFVRHRETGLIVEPTPAAVADAMDQLWDDRSVTRKWGHSARGLYDDMKIEWPKVVEKLLE